MTAELVVAAGFDARAAAEPWVDLVVAVHDLTRPVGRAVTSALATRAGDVPGRVRVTVACHELAAADVAAVLPPALADRTRLLEVRDGLGSPSGPFNAGLDLTSADHVAIMGSDDILEPGALLAWRSRAQTSGADVVLARMRMQDGAPVNTPRVRPRRTERLDPVADRLAYRTAPIGLLRRGLLVEHGLRLDEGMKNGGDLAFTVRLWDLAERVDLAADDPAYVIGLDARTRVTTTPRPLPVELTSTARLLERDFFARLPPAYRRAVAVKVLRIHVLGAVVRRVGVSGWEPGEVDALRGLVTALVGAAPGVLRPFSRADLLLVRACLDPAATRATIAAAVAARAGAGRRLQLTTSPLTGMLDRESTLRAFLADRFWSARG